MSFGNEQESVPAAQRAPGPGRPRRFPWLLPPPDSLSVSKRRALMLLAVSGGMELSTRGAFALGLISATARDAFALSALAVLALSAFYVFNTVRSIGAVRVTITLGIVCLVLFQIGDILDEFPIFDDNPLLGKEQPLHRFVEQSLVIAGGLLMAAGFCFALIDGEAAARRLSLERQWLHENIAERRRAETALKESRDRLEDEVTARTAELADRNAHLQVELAERRWAESRLALRLRYEEGLAGCSQALLAGADPAAGLRQALQHLLQAAEATRVYVIENYETEDEGLCMRLTNETWDPRLAPDCRPTPGLAAPYQPAYSRWEKELGEGRAIVGAVDALPPGERAMLERFNVGSVLLLPLNWDGKWRGFIGLDDNDPGRRWSPEELRMLRTAAEMVNACKEREAAENALRSAHDDLEQRVTARTQDLLAANERLQREIADRRRAESEKRDLESRLRQAQKMQAIGTLAGGIAHDFNNILSSIIGYTEMALLKLPEEAAQRRYLDEVLSAGHRAKELVRQILVFSRQSEHQRTSVALHEIASEAAGLVEAACQENITIERRIDPESGAVLSDPVLLHQVCMNLYMNALHAMRPKGGRLEIAVEACTLDDALRTPHSELQPGAYVRLSVTDTGHGMSPEILDRIYEPFFTTKPVGEGTGMGLAIVHGIVTGQGGGILVESAPGKGTAFHLYLPRFAQRAESADRPRRTRLNGDERLLVVDDEGQLASLWREMLTGYGYRVTAFTRSLDALAAFESDPAAYDLALLDQTMPQLSGSELAAKMLAQRPEMPILLATGFSDAITAEDAHRMGIREFILKPIIARDLAAAIRRALDNGAPPA